MSDEAKKVKEKKAPKQGVGYTATHAILAGKTNEEAFAAVQAAHPEAKTTMASINWYRNKLRGEGKEVQTSRELRAASKPPKEPKPKKAKKAADPLA